MGHVDTRDGSNVPVFALPGAVSAGEVRGAASGAASGSAGEVRGAAPKAAAGPPAPKAAAGPPAGGEDAGAEEDDPIEDADDLDAARQDPDGEGSAKATGKKAKGKAKGKQKAQNAKRQPPGDNAETPRTKKPKTPIASFIALKTRYGQVMADMSAIESTIENDPKLEALKNSSPLKMMTAANAELGGKINTNFRRSVLASGSAGTLNKAAKKKPEELFTVVKGVSSALSCSDVVVHFLF